MPDATISVDIALTTAPTAAPAWTSVTAYAESFSLRRGRQGPLETAGAGTATLRLANGDRRFDPRHTTGPYYGTLKPMRRLRIRATWSGITYDLFHGYVSGWPQSRESYGIQVVTLSCADAFKVLQLAEVNGAFVLQRSDERIAAVLGASGWVTGQGWMLGDTTYGVLGTTTRLGPVGDRALDQGRSQVQAVTLADTQALSHIQAVEQSENGFFFVGKDGAAMFHNRHRRLVAGSGASSATFGDSLTPGSGELPYVSATLDYDDQQIYNDVRVTTIGGVEQVATDSASQLDYFKRSYSRSVLVPTDAEALSVATYLKSQFKD
ncbi:MAG TPA: hypothetical protein VNM48_08480, partial [Chloroflexota bacterium]|nr:hypothetical protein [Chloroflexota bacterium]